MFYSSLGELFDALNKNEEEYSTAFELIKSNNHSIIQEIRKMIDDTCVEVIGLSYDHDGNVYGYDYDETYLEHYNLSGMKIHSIDDIDEDKITASLWIYGNIDVNCYFKDFENALWDSENEEYICVNVRHILEKHNARFVCRIEFNKKMENIRVFPFKIVLGGDSRKSRNVIYDEQEDFLYKELEDMERKELGFLPLSQYRDMLENTLNESSMAQEMFKLFDQYNTISSCYENIANLYDEIYNQINSNMSSDDANVFIADISSKKCIPIDFSEKNINKQLDQIKKWLDCKIDMLSEKMDQNLPDFIEYGENISILGTSSKVYTLSLDELDGTPEPGSEEKIEVSLLLGKKIVAKGYVTLTVGYLDFDEDGGAAQGIDDCINYEVDDVLDALKDIISNLKDELVNEQKLVSHIETCLNKQTCN